MVTLGGILARYGQKEQEIKIIDSAQNNLVGVEPI